MKYERRLRAKRSGTQRRTAGIGVLAVVALAAAACGSSGSSSNASGTSASVSGKSCVPNMAKADAALLPASWCSVVSTADKEGKVIFYTTTPSEQLAPVISAFNKIYPDIQVETVNDSVATLPARYQQERNSTGKSPADVLNSATFESLISANPSWFNTISSLGTSYFPSLKQFEPQATPASRPRSVASAAYTWELIYNTNMLKASEVPTSWKDLTDPKWKGKGIMTDPGASISYMAFFDLLYDKYGAGYLAGLKANKFVVSQSASDVAQQVASGAYEIGFVTNASKAAPVVQQHAPVKTVSLQPYGVGATTTSFPVKPPDPAAARVFGNFMLSSQAQELQCAASDLATFNKDASGACSQYAIPKGVATLPFSVQKAQQTQIMADLGINS
jgi:iron(III) transport system substrate-binding protein